jgi:PIN domain nuclease of toxin-antitoxin system
MARTPLNEAPLTFDIALETERIELLTGDPVDRFLVATARSLALTLVTADRKIVGTKDCSILPNR